MFTVAPHCQIMDKLDLIDLSRKLVSIRTINFVINLCLILLIRVKHPMCRIVSIRHRPSHCELRPEQACGRRSRVNESTTRQREQLQLQVQDYELQNLFKQHLVTKMPTDIGTNRNQFSN
jgi:hypothetical protein